MNGRSNPSVAAGVSTISPGQRDPRRVRRVGAIRQRGQGRGSWLRPGARHRATEGSQSGGIRCRPRPRDDRIRTCASRSVPCTRWKPADALTFRPTGGRMAG
jgi:hypothetical protein